MGKQTGKILISLVFLSALLFSYFVPSEEKANASVKADVQFKGKILRDVETHYYKFTTVAEGTIEVTWGQDTLGSDFIITDKHWSKIYWLGDVLPKGDYFFVVSTNPVESPDDPSIVSYDFTLSGLPFKKLPDATLPQLHVTSPQKNVNRLPAGDQTVTIEGSSNAKEVRFGIFGPDLPAEIIQSPFKQTLYFTDASPTHSAYRITAINESGNRINRNYEFIHPHIIRVEGKNMYEVSANAAAEYAKYPVNDEPEKIDTVFLANGDDPSYSLSVTPLAKIHNAPILLTTRHHLPKSIMKQIRALKPTTVVLLGSPKVISPKIVKELRLLGIKEIKRINGNDPISLSEQAAKKIDENGQGFIDTAIIASSSSSENLITASAAAAVLQYPILLVEKDNIPNKIKTFIKNHPNYKRFIIIGNESSISKEVEDTIRSYNKEIQIDRISGKDVYEVSANSARYFGFGITNMAIVNGDGIDAVIGSSIVSKLGGTVLLTPPDKLHSSIKAYLDEQVAKSADMLQVYMIGDPSRISDQVYKQIRSYLK